jgi:hypothetical protein
LVPAISLTSAQRQLPIARNVAMLGAVCGVVLGCAIGAMVGLFTTDVTQRDREQRDLEITTIMLRLLGAHRHQDWRLYIPIHGMLLWKELEQQQQQQRLSVGKYDSCCQLLPLEEDPIAKHCLALSAISKNELVSMPSDDGNSLYIPLGKWAVLRCRLEDQWEAKLVARHVAIVLDTLLPTHP